MKNKTLTYCLMVVVVAIWGLVFYKFFFSLSSDEQVIRPALNGNKVFEFIPEETDTFQLLANYRDPFLDKQTRREVKQIASTPKARTLEKSPKIQKVIPVKPQPDLSLVRFHGVILNSNKDRKIALVSLRGKEVMISEGQSIDDLTFIKDYKDSIQVKFQGLIGFISR